MKATDRSKKDRRVAAMNAAAHRSNVLAAAAADRHVKFFDALFAEDADLDELTADGAARDSYLADAAAMRS